MFIKDTRHFEHFLEVRHFLANVNKESAAYSAGYPGFSVFFRIRQSKNHPVLNIRCISILFCSTVK